LELPTTWKIHPVFHVSLLKKWIPNFTEFPDRQPTLPPPVQIEGQQEYKVERILDERIRRNHKKYLVKWNGYEEYDATWEPLSNLKNPQEVIKDYKKEMM